MNTMDEAQARDLSKIEKPTVSVTVLIFSVNSGKLETVLINRVREPFKGFWSLPGDILPIDMDPKDFAREVLHDKTGIRDVFLEQLYTFGNPKRDPRGRVITISFFALLPHNSIDLTKAPNALHASWTPVENLPENIAFDHREIISYGVERLKNKMEYSNIANSLVPEKFRLYDLQTIYEIILGKKLDKRNFRKKLLSMGLVKATKEMYREGNHRPAKLYRFATRELIEFN